MNDGVYQGKYGYTDENGQATLNLPDGDYTFQTLRNGFVYAGVTAEVCSVPTCSEASLELPIDAYVTVTVQTDNGQPQAGLPVFVFDGDLYTGLTGVTDEYGQLYLSLPENHYTLRAYKGGRAFTRRVEADCETPDCSTVTVEVPDLYVTEVTYTYDPLGRLTEANSGDESYYHYTYDRVGNRLSEETLDGTIVSTYDDANRLTSLDGMNYTWDANGNLIKAGLLTYIYDQANRLTEVKPFSMPWPGGGGNDDAMAYGLEPPLPVKPSYTYTYNGLGDRTEEFKGRSLTRFVLDLNTHLTQVLQDKINSYLYGIDRLAQENAGEMNYFLTDALGNVRQLADADGNVTLEKRYAPYGEELGGAEAGVTSYGFTGEWTDDTTDLVYLRARWYAPQEGRFTTKDTWQGDHTQPISYNAWLYGYANPVKYTDPSGNSPISRCGTILLALAMADGPLPPGDMVGIIGCITILGTAWYTAWLAAQQADEIGTAIDQCWTWEKIANLPITTPDPQQQPKPKPTPPEPIPYFPDSTPEPEHIFFFSELGDYSPGRPTPQIVADLEYISYIPGIQGMINQLESARIPQMAMGRKFEAERAINYARQNMLQEVNSTSPYYDLTVSGVATIRFVEVKWAQGTISRATLMDVIQQARLHPSLTFLLETTWISLVDQKFLYEEGGREYP